MDGPFLALGLPNHLKIGFGRVSGFTLEGSGGLWGLQFGSRWFQDGTWSLVWSLLGPAELHFGTSGVLLGTPWAFLGASLPLLGPK